MDRLLTQAQIIASVKLLEDDFINTHRRLIAIQQGKVPSRIEPEARQYLIKRLEDREDALLMSLESMIEQYTDADSSRDDSTKAPPTDSVDQMTTDMI